MTSPSSSLVCFFLLNGADVADAAGVDTVGVSTEGLEAAREESRGFFLGGIMRK